MYRKRMLGYYPQVIQSILEFQAIVDSESPEIQSAHSAGEDVISNAYLTTMDVNRIKQWETLLGITPVEGSTEDDRRDTVIARIRGQGKLNSALINTIVKTFTGGTAKSRVENGVLYVEITPPPDNKGYIFANVEQELAKKIPAHLGLNVSRNYVDWGDIKTQCATWQDVLSDFGTWNNVLLTITE